MPVCSQCKKQVDHLFQLLYSSGKVCHKCFELELKEGLLEEIEWKKFELSSRLRDIMEESFWECDFTEEKAYLRKKIKDYEQQIKKLDKELKQLDDMS